jgi:hypothetical protein
MEQLLDPATLALLIPIVAIVYAFVVKLRKLEIEREKSVGNEQIQALHKEVLSLRRRMENVEAIVAEDELKISLDDVTKESENSREAGNENGLKNMLR